jgi:hypothetical protein
MKEMGRFGGAASGKPKTAPAASGLVPKVRRTKSRRSIVMAAALTAFLVVMLCSNALAAVGLEAGIEPIEGSLSPAKLPRHTRVPITIHLAADIQRPGASNLNPVKSLTLRFDRHGQFDLKDLPDCQIHRLEEISTTPQDAQRACREALVGEGSASAEVALPEKGTFITSGPMLIFNGHLEGGRPALTFYVVATGNGVAPTTFIFTAAIEKTSGKYGTQIVIQPPTYYGGRGSLTGFEAKIGKTWIDGGHKRSFLWAECPTGALFAQEEIEFNDGQRISGVAAKSCS